MARDEALVLAGHPDAASDELTALQTALAGRYTVERELGRGGMGVVLLARDHHLERLVAIKLLPPPLAAHPELRDRFLRESRTAAGLSHPNIVPIHAVEARDGLVYFVMGYIDGETLTQRVRRVGPLPPAEVARVLREAAWALSYAHGRGIVHRDVKPDNVLIERATSRTLITDFGIARVADSTLTAAGQSLGTPQFMSPEQVTGEPVDARSDIYSLGIVGFFALTGRLPIDAPTVQAVLAMQVTKPAPPVASVRAGIPAPLAEAIDRCLRKDPDDRWPTAEALVAALDVGSRDAPQVAPPLRNFMRMSELALTQFFMLLSVIPVMGSLKPAEPFMLVVWLLAMIVVLGVQLGLRARLLVGQGFTYEDLLAAYDVESRQRLEEVESIQAGLAASNAEPSRTRWVLVVLGAALVAAALYASDNPALKAEIPRAVRRLVAVMGLLLVMLPLIFRSSRMLRIERRGGRIAARMWRGGFGRWLFRSLTRSRDARGAGAPAVVGSRSSLTTLPATVPGLGRRRQRAARSVIEALETEVVAMERRDAELSAALDEASTTTPGRGEVRADAGMAGRRAQVADELRVARQAAAERRERAMAALEGLRLQLLRLRSGLGSTADLEAELAAGRSALGGGTGAHRPH